MYQQHLNEVRASQIQQDRRREAAVERSLRAAGAPPSEEEIPAREERGAEPQPAGLRGLLRGLLMFRRGRARRAVIR